MVIGDLNARIGNYQNPSVHFLNNLLNFESNRNTKDETLNGNGRLISGFLEDFGLFLLNGVAKGDECGELTFISGQGESVIDFCAISGEWCNVVNDFKVLLANFSAHMPILVRSDFDEQAQQRTSDGCRKLKWHENKADRYKSLLDSNSNLLPDQTSSTIDEIEGSITSLIYASAPLSNNSYTTFSPKSKWFDKDCYKLRKLSFQYLKLFRTTNAHNFKSMYLRANKEFKQLCDAKKMMYHKNIAQQLQLSKNSKEFWHNVREVSGRQRSMKISPEAQTLAAHFKTLLSAEGNLHTFSFALPNSCVPQLDLPISSSELVNTLSQMKNNKAPGSDGIPVEFFKNSNEHLKNYILNYFNLLYENACVPSNFPKALIYPIFKKGDPDQPENYRGISILNSLRKIFAGILYGRLSSWIESTSRISIFQAGFRAGFSTTDHIFALISIARHYVEKNKKLYVCFVDFKAAFDTVNRQALLYKLSTIGVSRKFLMLYFKFLASSSAAVWDGSKLSEWFASTAGVPQGCILSPLLFALFIDDVSSILPGGVLFAGTLIKVLLYADDLVLLADNPFALQHQINKLSAYCDAWNLHINVQKTKAMVFQSRRSRRLPEETWRLGNEQIDSVLEFKYLGVLLTYNLNLKKHAKEKSCEAKLALNMMWPTFFANQNIDHSSKFKVFNATVNTCMCYGTQAFGVTPFEEFEVVQRVFFKRIFRLPNSTPTHAIHVESGLPPIYIRNLKANSDYCTRVMRRNDANLHKMIMARLVRTNASPFREWNQLALSHDLSYTLTESNVNEWPDIFATIISKIDDKIFDEHLTRCSSSTSRTIYKNLNHRIPTEDSYFNVKNSAYKISIVFRARVEILNLNFVPHRIDLQQICALCNRRELDDIYHFVAVCPILQEIRRLYFQESFLSVNSLYEILNGARGWSILYNYCKHALTYRNSF